MNVLPRKSDCLAEIFPKRKPIIGTIHCLPFPGAPRYEGGPVSEIVEHAVSEALAYAAGGIDGLIVENEGDFPFLPPDAIGVETVSMMAVVAAAVIAAVTIPVGVMILANGAIPSIAVAKSVGARFVRVNQWVNAYVSNEGLLEGPSGKALRFRSNIYARDVKIFADVHVKHGSHSIVADRPVQEQAADAEFYDADVEIATGQRTGDPTSVDEILEIRQGTNLPVIVGSGLNRDNAAETLHHADGAIIGSSLKFDGHWWNRVDPKRVDALMKVVESVRNNP